MMTFWACGESFYRFLGADDFYLQLFTAFFVLFLQKQSAENFSASFSSFSSQIFDHVFAK